MRTVAPVFFLVYLLACTQGIVAQQTPPSPKATPPRTDTTTRGPQQTAPPMPVLPDIRNDPDVKAADIAIIANVTAEELRFDVVPNSTVEFPGKPQSETIWHADRFNLPDKIEPGVTYRNIGIRLKITSTLADIDRIVAEALGEKPISNDQPARENNVVSPASGGPAKSTVAPAPAPAKRAPGE